MIFSWTYLGRALEPMCFEARAGRYVPHTVPMVYARVSETEEAGRGMDSVDWDKRVGM